MEINALENDEQLITNMYNQISNVITENKTKMIYQINSTLVETNFMIGKIIVENEQTGNIRAEYGKDILKKLSKKLTNEFGSGFSLSGLYNMRLFYNRYKNFQPLAGNLSWSHYCYLIYIEDDDERSFYEKECINSKWSKRELKRQIDSSLFQRLLLSNGKTNKKKVLELSKKGQVIKTGKDLIKDPFVLEFLDIKDNDYVEKDLEQNILKHLKEFMLELGRGFMFVGSQVRITLEQDHFYPDLIFYNRIAKCFVIIDLKMGDITHGDLGQMQMYVNYYDRKIKSEEENPTIGILLSTNKNNTVVKYTLPEDNNSIFAALYKLNMPTEQELIEMIEEEKKNTKLMEEE